MLLNQFMYSQLKEEKLKQEKKYKRKQSHFQFTLSPIYQKSEKKHSKNTPMHSQEKSDNKRNSSKTQKQDKFESQYYTQTKNLENPLNPRGSQTYDGIINEKKKNRRSGNKKNKKISPKKKYQLKRQGNEYKQEKDSQQMHNLKSPILKKIKMLSSQGDIGYKADGVRNNRLKSQKNSFYSHLSSPDKQQENVVKNCKLTSKKRKKKSKENKNSKSKNKKNKIKETKQKKDIKDNQNPYQNVKQSYNLQKQATNAKLSIINIERLQKEVEEENENVFEYILSDQMLKQRGFCFNIIGKICSSMNLKRQTFSMAISYIDGFIDQGTQPKSLKPISITALMMALKIQHSQGVIGPQPSSLSTGYSMTSTKALSISLQAKSLEKKKKQIIEQNGYQKFNLNRPKFPNILTTVLSHEQIYSQYDRILCKQQIMDLQMQMMVKLNFKLTIKTSSHWIESLTVLWDNFIQNKKIKQKVCFRSVRNINMFSFLCQIIEISYYFPYAYFYSKVIIILSTMYLLVRINAQSPVHNQQKTFQLFKTSLTKSTNLIFVDKFHINQLFGQFLGIIKLDLGDIVNCCQYISHYLNYKMFRKYPAIDNKSLTLDQCLSSYQYNPELFRFFQLKCENQFSQR